MDQLTLEARPREAGKARQTRREGWIPAVVYGQGAEGTSIAVERSRINRLLGGAGARGLLSLQVAGESGPRRVVLKDIQEDPVRAEVIHLDFHEVSLTEKVVTQVPIRIVGDEDVPAQAVLQHQLHEVDVESLPQDIPEAIEVDVSHLEVGDSLLVGDLTPPEGARITNEPDQVVASLLVARMEAEADGADPEDGEEPAEAAADGDEGGSGDAD